MQTAEVRPGPQFAGSADEQQIARDVFEAMRGMGRFFSRTAPIRVSVASLAEFLAAQRPEQDATQWTARLTEVLTKNPNVFDLEESGDQLLALTTAAGEAPSRVNRPDTEHTLAQRLTEPTPVTTKQWTSRRQPAPLEELVAPAAEATAEAAVSATPAGVIQIPEPAEEELEEEEATPAAAPVTAPVTTANLDQLNDEQLADVISDELRRDLTVANVGDRWMAEDKVPRLSRGDLRRIHDYIVERNEPLSDETLLQDILGVRPGADNYALMRFAVNYRLSRETKEFEFVGTPDQRLWSTAALPAIGTTKRKPSEIGQEYRFLLSEPPLEILPDERVAEHVLTFYEYQYGVLPLNPVFQALFPAAMLPEQRAAVLSFEAPQTYETFLVELRYPTGNRGGYLAGFDRFFLENLVPGALFTVERDAENDGRYLIEYLPVSGETEKLLQVDEKRNRYVFRPRTFYCATSDEMLLTENRFPQFANAAPLEERTRRRPELTLAATFERIGEQVGTTDQPRYMAMLDDLLAASNVERPMSAELIRAIVTSGDHPDFSTDPEVTDVYYFQPERAG
ncbi:MAG TPA: hypothetical protein VFI42_18715 [Thermomicrobiaceae bacterium]|nr:hypothetical protein [Thermomicrobiaceae bacterium]